MAVDAVEPGRWVRRRASAIEVDGYWRIGALFTVGDILEQVFGFSFETLGTIAEGVVLGNR